MTWTWHEHDMKHLRSWNSLKLFNPSSRAFTFGTSTAGIDTTLANSGGGGTRRRFAPNISWSLRNSCNEASGLAAGSCKEMPRSMNRPQNVSITKAGSCSRCRVGLGFFMILHSVQSLALESSKLKRLVRLRLCLRRAWRECSFSLKICRSCERCSSGKSRSRAILRHVSLQFTCWDACDETWRNYTKITGSLRFTIFLPVQVLNKSHI